MSDLEGLLLVTLSNFPGVCISFIVVFPGPTIAPGILKVLSRCFLTNIVPKITCQPCSGCPSLLPVPWGHQRAAGWDLWADMGSPNTCCDCGGQHVTRLPPVSTPEGAPQWQSTPCSQLSHAIPGHSSSARALSRLTLNIWFPDRILPAWPPHPSGSISTSPGKVLGLQSPPLLEL